MSKKAPQDRSVRYFLVGIIAGLFAMAGAQVAVAAITTTVRTDVVTVGGKCYEAKATMNTSLSTPTGYAYGWVMTSSCGANSTVPSGYMQMQAITYRNGTVCLNKLGSTNSSTVSNMTLGAAKDCGFGSYKAKAGVFGYNPSTGFYSVGYTVFSPIADT